MGHRYRLLTAGPVLCALVSSGFPARAQTIDPEVLQRVQGQLGVNSASTQLDTARRQTEDRPGAITGLPSGRVDTTEEQQLRRFQARQTLEGLYVPTPVEREYRQRLGDSTLRQFGYDLFAAAQPATGELTGAVGNDYVLGIGDEIIIAFQGATNKSVTARVDREGRLVVGELRPIPAAGRTLGAVRAELAAATRQSLIGTEVVASVGSVRAISVFVGGEVERPGQYNLTSLSDVVSALAQAGGVRRSGTLRRIRVVHAGGGGTTVDLYGVLGIGATSSVRLRDGDRVIVPVIGPTAAVAAGAARPGIYELNGRTSVGQLLAFAGGTLRAQGDRIAISRIGAGGSELLVRSASLATPVLPGDGVQLLGGSAGGLANRVILRGFVDNPGPRPLSAAPTVRALLGAPADLRFETYMPMAVLVRRDPVTGARALQGVNLLSALRASSMPLRSEDRLYVFSQADIDFVNSGAVRSIVLGQSSDIGCRSLVFLQTLARDTQSPRFTAVTRGTYVLGRGEAANVGATLVQGGARRGDEATAAGLSARAEQTALRAPNTDLNRDFTARGTGVDSAAASTDAAEGAATSRLTCPVVFEEEPELLPFLIEHAVAVSGAVRRPGAYPIADSLSAAEVAALAEGVVANARALTLDIGRASALEPVTDRVPVDADGRALLTTRVAGGDDLRFNAGAPAFEASGVLLSGEVARPGLYVIRRGETLSQLIERAGGLTSFAYPYGSIFTRKSVQIAQQEALRRTARELNEGLLNAVARSHGDSGGSSGAGIAAASQLVQQISTAETPGRVVVEADPRAIAVRPDLDSVLEAGDSLFVPKRPNFVLVLGDVLNPGALQFVSGKTVLDYVREGGGISRSADRHRIFLIYPNGIARPIRGGPGGGFQALVVPPGSTVIVPKNVDPLRTLDTIRDIAQIISGFAISAATVGVLATRN